MPAIKWTTPKRRAFLTTLSITDLLVLIRVIPWNLVDSLASMPHSCRYGGLPPSPVELFQRIKRFGRDSLVPRPTSAML